MIFIPAVMLALVSCSDDKAELRAEVARPVKTMLIGASDDVKYRAFPGKVEAGKDAILSFQVSGELFKFPAIKGQEIKKGELIGRIEPTDFQLKINESKAKVNQARLTFERLTELVGKGFASKSEYDKGEAIYEIAKANLELAEQNLGYTFLYAPFTGRIADTYPEQHQYVNAKEAIALLQDTQHIDIAIDIPESLIIKIKETKVLERLVVFEAAPTKEYKVVYKKHVLEADPVTQTYRVYMTMPTPNDLSVLPGMTATVKFAFIIGTEKDKDSKDFFLVPSRAVFADEHGKKFVWKVDKESRITAQSITVGDLSEDNILITSGLNSGEEIVITGVHTLREGQLVSPLEK